MSPKSVDLRIQRTLQRIRAAFLELLDEQPFDQITVSALAARAEINRATFYRHYADIYHLAQAVTEEIDATTLVQVQDDPDPLAGVRALFEHVAEYASFYRAMMRPGGIPGFRAHMEEMVAVQMTALLPHFAFDPARAAMPPALVVRYLAAAQVAFVQWWLEHDMPFSADTAAAYLALLHTQGGWQALALTVDVVPAPTTG